MGKSIRTNNAPKVITSREEFVKIAASIPQSGDVSLEDVAHYFHERNTGYRPGGKKTISMGFADGPLDVDITAHSVSIRGEDLSPSSVFWVVKQILSHRLLSSPVANVEMFADGEPLCAGEIHEAALMMLQGRSTISRTSTDRFAYRVIHVQHDDQSETVVAVTHNFTDGSFKVAYFQPGVIVDLNILMESEDGPILVSEELNGWRASWWSDKQVADHVQNVKMENFDGKRILHGGDSGILAALSSHVLTHDEGNLTDKPE